MVVVFILKYVELSLFIEGIYRIIKFGS